MPYGMQITAGQQCGHHDPAEGFRYDDTPVGKTRYQIDYGQNLDAQFQDRGQQRYEAVSQSLQRAAEDKQRSQGIEEQHMAI